MLLKAEMLIRWRMVDGLPQRKGGIRKGKASKCEQMRGSCELLPEAKCWGRDAREKERSDHWGGFAGQAKELGPICCVSLSATLPPQRH